MRALSAREPLLSPRQLARFLGVTERTLGGWRASGTGPGWMKFKRHIRYSRRDVTTWLTDRRNHSSARAVQREEVRA